MKNFVLILLLLTGCGPRTSEDFLAEGEAKTRQLLLVLRKVETKEDLIKAEPVLRKKYHDFSNLIQAAQKYLDKNPQEMKVQENRYSGDLLCELRRIYKIQGGREIMERAAKEHVEKLKNGKS